MDHPVPVGDAYPPSDVRDLSVVLVNFTSSENVTFELKWTAPGDDLDIGTGKIQNFNSVKPDMILSGDCIYLQFPITNCFTPWKTTISIRQAMKNSVQKKGKRGALSI